jgi:hypothetical protein
MTTWLGVDVGGPRKGFDAALVDDLAVVELRERLTVDDVVVLAERARPAVVGIDSPRVCAPPGATSRASERLLAREVCGIRWTPDEPRVRGSAYYGWVVHGLELYAALMTRAAAEVIEVFPTASWTRWRGGRDGRSRSAWTREGLRALGLAGVPERTNQDQRDAIAAAVTARQHTAGTTQTLIDIVVPASRT